MLHFREIKEFGVLAMKKIFPGLLILSAVLLVSSCGNDAGDNKTLKIGLMPAVDTVPFFYAQENNLFEKHGIDVEFTLYTNAQNRQTALQANQIDGAITDLIALITNVAGGFKIKGTMSTDGAFPLLVYPGAEDYEVPSVGMMEISVSNYLVEQYLADRSYSKVYINEIPMRLEAVASGRLQMGLFPEPVASMGSMNGLTKLEYPGIPHESLDILVFTDKSIKKKRKSIEAFHRAYSDAVNALQNNTGKARDIVIKNIPNVPPAVRDQLIIPDYKAPRLPSPGFTEEIIEWTALITKGNISIRSDALFDDRFIGQ